MLILIMRSSTKMKCPTVPWVSRIDTLKNNWNNYQANDHKLFSLKKDEHSSQEYFKNAVYRIVSVEEFYTDEYGKFLEVNSQLVPSPSPIANVPQDNHINIHELSRIEVPNFSGNFYDWLEFKDLFTEIVIKEKISESEKLRHLKTHVKGEAADILRSVQASQGNFQEAWKLLDDYYSDKKRLEAMFIESILDQPSLKSSSLCQLKKLIAGVKFSLNSLEKLGRSTKQ